MATSVSAPVDSAPPRPRGIAPVWHTMVLILFVLAFSLGGAVSKHERANAHHILGYAQTAIVEILMVLFIVWGLRRYGFRMRDLVGERWKTPEKFLLDVALAFGTWLVLMILQVVIGVIAIKLHWLDMDKAQQMRKSLEFLLPHGTAEVIGFAALCVTAGICEEIIFRGYFQRQIGEWISNLWLGTFLSALLFGLAHGYQGPYRMAVIVLIGFVLGTLANLRKNLRPGMITHAWFDFCSGVLLPKLATWAESMRRGM
jgi:membrane protease YdiL (CAAX protease family)